MPKPSKTKPGRTRSPSSGGVHGNRGSTGFSVLHAQPKSVDSVPFNSDTRQNGHMALSGSKICCTI